MREKRAFGVHMQGSLLYKGMIFNVAAESCKKFTEQSTPVYRPFSFPVSITMFIWFILKHCINFCFWNALKEFFAYRKKQYIWAQTCFIRWLKLFFFFFCRRTSKMSSDMSAGDFRGEFRWAGKEHPHFKPEMNVVAGHDLYSMNPHERRRLKVDLQKARQIPIEVPNQHPPLRRFRSDSVGSETGSSPIGSPTSFGPISVPSSSLPSEASGRFLSRAFSLEKTRPTSAEKYFKNEFDIKWQ